MKQMNNTRKCNDHCQAHWGSVRHYPLQSFFLAMLLLNRWGNDFLYIVETSSFHRLYTGQRMLTTESVWLLSLCVTCPRTVLITHQKQSPLHIWRKPLIQLVILLKAQWLKEYFNGSSFVQPLHHLSALWKERKCVQNQMAHELQYSVTLSKTPQHFDIPSHLPNNAVI